MFKQLKILFLVCTFSIIFLNCTKFVWEDRGECPCVLTLNLSNVNNGIDTLHLWIFGADNDILYRDTIGSEEFNNKYKVLINRGMVKYFLWGNISKSTILKDNLTINSLLTKIKNLSADSLYYYTNLLNTNYEYACDTVSLNKEFITMDVALKGKVAIGDSVKVELLGSSNGFYIDKRFVVGESKVVALPYYRNEDTTLFKYRLTRQEHLSNMKMYIILEHNGIPITLEEFRVGKWLKLHGYNMQAVNLSDIKIEFDLSMNFVTIKVDNWQVTVPANVEI
ncbi:MAG: hypothetical protein RSC28_02155 [Bacteroidales bacterium]